MTSPHRAVHALDEPPGASPPASPPPRWVIYVDLDAYYVSCEIRDRPELAGKPVIVGPPPSAGPTRGVVLSASYEARPSGVRSALPVQIAARLCPEAIWVPPDFEKYERVSGEVRDLLRTISSDVLPLSIDEAAVGVDAAGPEEARAIAERIQRSLSETLRLPSSLGVATTRLVAKMATDAAKPGRIVVVPPEEVARFVAPLPVRAVPGVGPKTEQRLLAEGIVTVGDLAGRSPAEAARWLGAFGRELVALARGAPHEAPVVPSGPRSRSTARTFASDVTDWRELEEAVRALADDLARALDREGMRYGAVGVGLRWSDFTRAQRVRTLSGASEGPASIADRAVRLARELWEAESAGRGRAVRTISVRAERLAGRHLHQVSLDEFGGRAGARR